MGSEFQKGITMIWTVEEFLDSVAHCLMHKHMGKRGCRVTKGAKLADSATHSLATGETITSTKNAKGVWTVRCSGCPFQIVGFQLKDKTWDWKYVKGSK
jgi:hypothetical protein